MLYEDWRGQPHRACIRCGVELHPTDVPPGEHLCKDIVRRAREHRDREFAAYARELVVHGGEA